MEIDYKKRIEYAECYLENLNSNFEKGWANVYEDYLNGNLSFLEKVTLIHPDFIRNLNLPAHLTHFELITSIQGNRSFRQEYGLCQCELIWGYKCFYKDEICHGDHLFPYSLGGPTIAGNKLLLCKYHNMVKGTDIHLFPWESNVRLTWIDSHIDKLAKRIQLYIIN